MMIKDNADNRSYVTLLSLISENSGKFDVCALIYDVCTLNNNSSYNDATDDYDYDSITKRMLDIRDISKKSYMDLKYIVRYIINHYVSKTRKKEKESDMIVFTEENEIPYVSLKFDAVFIYRIIEKYYHGELKGGKANAN